MTTETSQSRPAPDQAPRAKPAVRMAGANAYREQEIMTASPANLVAKLYEAAITALRQAIKAIETGEIEQRCNANRRAVDIIEHLLFTLDLDRGGEIAANLKRLYEFMMRQLVNVDVHNDAAPARAVIGLLEPLHRSWRELDERRVVDIPTTPDRRQQTPAPAAAPGYGRDQQPLDATARGRVFSSA